MHPHQSPKNPGRASNFFPGFERENDSISPHSAKTDFLNITIMLRRKDDDAEAVRLPLLISVVMLENKCRIDHFRDHIIWDIMIRICNGRQ